DCGVYPSLGFSSWNTAGIRPIQVSESSHLPLIPEVTSRGMGTPRFGNLSDRLMNFFGLTEPDGQIALRDDADAAAVLVDDGNASDLMRFHPLFAVPDVLLGLAGHELLAHDIGHDDFLRGFARGDDSQAQVPVRDDSDQLLRRFIYHRN